MIMNKKKILTRICAVVLTCILVLSITQLLLVSAKASVTQGDLSVEVLDDNSPYQDDSFLGLVSVPTRFFTYENNGGAAQNSELSKAFDRNWNTAWVSGVDNNVPSNNPFYNTVTVHFNERVTLDGMLYASSSSRVGYGFATEFNIYAAVGNGEFALVGHGKQTATSSKVRIIFSKPVTCDHLKFEFKDVNRSHKYVASAKEFVFLQSNQKNDVDTLMNLFTDYAKYQIAPAYASLQAIGELRAKFQNNLNYKDNIKPILDRAERILNGDLVFDARREFSTAPDAENKIARNGDIVSYAKNTLKFNSFTTNRQVTGIAARADEVVNIYVEAEEGDPLPRIRFSQFYGHWSKWLGGEIRLSRGLNRLTVPYLKNSSYSKEVVSGGAIYIVNPYDETQQSSNVKVYIEDGDLYPVFRKDDDENTYKAELAEYVAAVNANPDKVINITELVSNHTMMTVQANRANELYQTNSPQENMENWETTVRDVLHFAGVEFEEGQPYYDKRNNFLNVNFRVSQHWPNGFMFCHTEHIGLYAGGSEDTLIRSVNDNGKSSIGWGFIHEIGHALDIPERTVGETTNNMVANYNNTYKLGLIRNENYFSSVLNSISSDRDLKTDLWGSDRYNYMVYWLLQSLDTNYWAKQENLYRYTTGITGLTKTEKQVYIASLAMGIDLSYYFERWGTFRIGSDPSFTYDGSSDAFKSYMQQAKDSGKVKEETKKFWYLDSAQYTYMMDKADLEQGIGGMYQETSTTEILNVLKVSNGYSLILPDVTEEAHLGYEILEGNDKDGYTVIGFTHVNTFTDTTQYPQGYEPTYKIVAYDRLLKTSQESAPKALEYQSEVCELKGVKYNTLSEAIAQASRGDTIYLLKNFIDSGVIIDKNLTITIKEDVATDITLYKGGDNVIFSVNAGCSLTVKGAADKKLILDGNRLKQKNSMITVAANGQLHVRENVTLQNNKNTGNGGAIYAPNASSKIYITGATICNNTAGSGGAIYNSGNVTVTDSKFTNNTATNGGAISNVGGGIITVKNTEITGNTSTNGGAVYIDGRTILSNSTLKNNTAQTGGAIYISPGANAQTRFLTVDAGTVISDNRAKSASVLYMTNGANVSLDAATIENSSTAVMRVLSALSKRNTAAAPAVYINSGNLQINGNTVAMQGTIYKNSGSVQIKGQMLNSATGKLVFSLKNYDVTTPVFTTNFDLIQEDLDGVSLANDSYTLIIGEDKRSVYLKAKEIIYTVQFNTNGGTIHSGTITDYIFGTTTTLPADITREGYTFAGWYETEDFSGAAVTEIAADTQGNKVYYAKWVQNPTPVDMPEEIVVLGRTAHTLTLAAKTGHEYSIDGGITWHRVQEDRKYVFEGLHKGTQYSILARLTVVTPGSSPGVKTLKATTALKDAREIAEEYIHGANLTNYNNKTDWTESAANHMVRITVDENGNYLIVPQAVINEDPTESDDGGEILLSPEQPPETSAETMLENVPETGDENSLMLWGALFICALGGLILLAIRLPEKKQKD